ncbi:MAG: PAS domain-containing protein, partial [Microthrixaceae bacterium]
MPSTTRQLPALVDDLDVGLWVLRADDGAIVDLNEVASRVLQRRVEDLRSTPFGDVLVPSLSAEAWRLLTQQIPDDGAHRITVSLRGPDATIVPAELTLRRSDEPSSILAATRDIADRVDLAERLRTQRALLDGTIETLDEGVAVIDRQGRIERTNSTFAALV